MKRNVKKKKLVAKKRKPKKATGKKLPERNPNGTLKHGWGKGSHNTKKLAKKKSPKKDSSIKRRRDGTLLPGQCLNPAGAGTKFALQRNELQKAIEEVETERGDSWLKELIRKSYTDTALAIALLSRLYASLKAIQVQESPGDSMSEEEKAEIRKEMRLRFLPVEERIEEAVVVALKKVET